MGRSKFRCRFSSFVLALPLLALPAPSHAAATETQTFELLPGWNAIYLQVDPDPNDPATVFQGLPVLSVWTRKALASSVQFIKDPREGLLNDPGWLVYVPAGQPGAVASNLFRIRGNRAYLVNAESAATLTVTGVPVIPHIRWDPDAFNLVGLPVDPVAPPTFAAFFAPSAAHAGQPIYHLLSTGIWERIAVPDSTTIHRGEAYWIFTSGQSDYLGPLVVKLAQPDGLIFGSGLDRRTIEIDNVLSTGVTFTLEELTDPLPLSYRQIDGSGNATWVPLEGATLSLPAAAGAQTMTVVELRRADMISSPMTSILQVTNGLGTLWNVPIEAEIPGASSSHAALLATNGAAPLMGLWVGHATINAVSQPQGGARCAGTGDHPFATCVTNDDCGSSTPCAPPGGKLCAAGGDHAYARCTSDADCGSSVPCAVEPPRFVPVPTQQQGGGGSTVQLRLILHVDAAGQVSLLKQVIQMLQNGTTVPDPDHPGYSTLATPGRFVFLTDDTLIPQFEGASLRDGRPVGLRMSSAGFDFPGNSVAMSGGFGAPNTLSCTIDINPNFPTNPFRHVFHPDHDNLDARGFPLPTPAVQPFPAPFPTPAGDEEVFAIRRHIELAFSATDPEGLNDPAFGTSEVGGTYTETIEGLHRSAIVTQGIFKLQLVAPVAELNQ